MQQGRGTVLISEPLLNLDGTCDICERAVATVEINIKFPNHKHTTMLVHCYAYPIRMVLRLYVGITRVYYEL